MIEEITEISKHTINDTAVDFLLGSIIGLAGWFLPPVGGVLATLATGSALTGSLRCFLLSQSLITCQGWLLQLGLSTISAAQ